MLPDVIESDKFSDGTGRDKPIFKGRQQILRFSDEASGIITNRGYNLIQVVDDRATRYEAS